MTTPPTREDAEMQAAEDRADRRRDETPERVDRYGMDADYFHVRGPYEPRGE